MKIVVIGAGIIGLNTAYQLVEAGFEVVLLDKCKSPACGATFQNGGQLSYSHAIPVSHAASFFNLTKAILSSDHVINISPAEFFKNLPYFYNLWSNNNVKQQIDKIIKFYQFSGYSRRVFAELNKKVNIKIEQGCLHLYRQHGKLKEFCEISKKQSESYRIINGDDHAEFLDNYDGLAGSVYFSADQYADARDFSLKLFAYLQKQQNFSFVQISEMKNILTEQDIVQKIILNDDREISFDKIVIATGAYSNAISKMVGLKLPILPVTGYSANIEGVKLKTSVIDADNKIVYTPLQKNYVRAAGLYDAIGFSGEISEKRRELFINKVTQMFDLPEGKLKNIELWQGHRSVSKDGFPIIGGSRKYQNLYYNLAHANLGWTLSAASGKILVEEIEKKSNNDYSFLAANRFKI